MRYALYRQYGRSASDREEVTGANERSRQKKDSMPDVVEQFGQSRLESRVTSRSDAQCREISLGTNEGTRIVELRQPKITWRKVKKVARAPDVDIPLQAVLATHGRFDRQPGAAGKRPLLGVGK
jgi:hypothetical protein